VDNVGFVIAGYSITVVAIAAYTAHLFSRAARAKRRAAAVAARTSLP
jgi:hypothetical protein